MSITDRVQRFKGCRYPDTLPDGRTARVQWGYYVVAVDEGSVSFPPGATAFDCLRIGPHGEVAGTANVGGIDRAFLWDGAWHDKGVAPGRNAVAWGPKGELCVVRSGDKAEAYYPDGGEDEIYGSFGSIGIRFISWDGRIITSAESYEDAARGLYEYTDWGDCAIGQGAKPDQGVVVRFADDGILRRFVFGVCRDVRWERDGEKIALSWTQQDTDEACVWTGTMDELRTLEPVVKPVPPTPPTPPTPPAPPDPPKPADTLVSQDGRFRLLMQNDGNLVIYGPNGTARGLSGVWPWEPPTPPGPVPQHDRIAASFYTAISDPRLDVEEFAHRLRDLGCTGTRAWLVSAWANGPNGPGQVDGWMPWLVTRENQFDLWVVSEEYLGRLHEFVSAMNTSGIIPTLTGWELYSWSERKEGMLWVPDMNIGPFRLNVQDLRYADDTAFNLIGTRAGDHGFLENFYCEVVKTLRGLTYYVEIGNEMLEKPMHERLRDAWRRAGYIGPIQVNRNRDTPGEWDNMGIGREFDAIAYHGKRDIGYLDEVFADEAPAGRPTTFRAFYATNPDPSRITLSSDGCRKGLDVADAYDYPALSEVAKDALARGYRYEHQTCLKLRTFAENRLDLNDLAYDAPFLRGLQ